MQTDFLIVGQGLAGTWLSYFLQQAGCSIVVVDYSNPSSASNISSGIVNPVTGRKLVKSWLFDTMIDFAVPAYRSLEKLLGIQAWHNRHIVWLLQTEFDLNNFTARSATEGYTNYITAVERGGWHPAFKETAGIARVSGGYLNSSLLIAAYRNYLQQQGCLVNDRVLANDVQLMPSGGVKWKNIEANQIVFCEGYLAGNNPYFSTLPFAPNKGEVLIVDVPGLNLGNSLVKGGVFLVPLPDGTFWAGSQYIHDTIDEQPSAASRQEIETALQRMLSMPYRVVKHLAGVRPSTDKRRPLLGTHPQYKQVAIFNGLGTKGVLMSAYFGHLLANHLLYNHTLPSEVAIEPFLTNG
ncbi:FAD-binding oxidoreductase [Sphingobacteriales bacterium UPWRP_1]|nr:hypothetical protein B6N25_10030 [Sphingobacteriales bacterium TSM_CSS]PSJ76396.1 FAD-binding oxidoreductase [Sphingobacteriales bacterium UPWRP_1]